MNPTITINGQVFPKEEFVKQFLEFLLEYSKTVKNPHVGDALLAFLESYGDEEVTEDVV